MKKLLFYWIAVMLLLCLSTEAQEWREVVPGDSIMLPSDLYVQRGYRIQWWYFTGHLYDTQKRAFGFELTFFVAGVQKRPYRSKFGVNTIYLANFAISDIEGKKFYHFSNADSGTYGFAGADSRRLHVWVGKDTLEGDLTRMLIKAHAQDADLDLVLIPKKPIILNGNKGYSRKSEESPRIASLYFSCTDLETTGTVKLGPTLFTVHGKSWFDREISSHGLAKDETGWDWFAIQLDDGREIMIYALRKKDGSIDRYSSGTVVNTDGNLKHLVRDDYRIEVLSSYTSRKTGIRYPSKWEITVPSENLQLLVTPSLEDQEFTRDQAMGGPYWEGTCTVEGSARGEAYAEMTGYE
ncbi:MAG TPA: lipocalin-like domain-containing protein [Nitrospirota bacterium]|nr:lipocalin-like domain-containing protein [Nitrospirota bacterium]